MKAPDADGTGSAGSGFATGYIYDYGVGGAPRTIFITSTLTAFDQFKVGDTVLVTGVPTLGGEYVCASVETFAALADGAVITTDVASTRASLTGEGI